MKRILVVTLLFPISAYAQVNTSMYNTGRYFQPIQPNYAPPPPIYIPPPQPQQPLNSPGLAGGNLETYRQNFQGNLPRQQVCYYNGNGALVCN